MNGKNITLGASIFSGVLAVVIGMAAMFSSSKPGFVHVAQPKISYIISEQSATPLEQPIQKEQTEVTEVATPKKPKKPIIKDNNTEVAEPKEDCKKSKDPLCGISGGKDIF